MAVLGIEPRSSELKPRELTTKLSFFLKCCWTDTGMSELGGHLGPRQKRGPKMVQIIIIIIIIIFSKGKANTKSSPGPTKSLGTVLLQACILGELHGTLTFPRKTFRFHRPGSQAAFRWTSLLIPWFSKSLHPYQIPTTSKSPSSISKPDGREG